MKKYSILFIIMMLLLLTACSKEDQGVIEPQEESELSLSQKLGRPPNLGVHTGEKTTYVELGYYCWEEDDKTCAIDKDDPIKLLEGLGSMTVQPNELINFSLGTTNLSHPNEILGMDNVEVELAQFHKGEERQITIDGDSFPAPEEKGKYYYLAKLTWNKEIKGEANFAFSFSVVD